MAQKFDLILLMWSEITEYNKQEQYRLISITRNLLSSSGRIVLELADLSDLKHPYATSSGEQKFEYNFQASTDNFYLPTKSELEFLYEEFSLAVERSITYQPNSFLRELAILKAF